MFKVVRLVLGLAAIMAFAVVGIGVSGIGGIAKTASSLYQQLAKKGATADQIVAEANAQGFNASVSS